MRLLKRVKKALGLVPDPVTIDGVTIRQIERNLREIGYSRRQAVCFITDLRKAIELKR